MNRLPEGWRSAALGEVCRVVSGGTPKTAVADYWDGDVPWITPKDMSLNKSQVLHGGQRAITASGLAASSATLFPAGSVIVSSRAPIGYVAIAGTEMATNQGCKIAIPPDYIDSRYLYWFLLHSKGDLEARSSGTTFKEISGKEFARTLLRWPPLEEQRHIVDILEDHLSRLDAGSATLNHAEAMLAGFREKVVRDAITGANVEGARIEDVPTAEGVDDGNLASLPAGWRWTRLRDLAEVVGGVTKDAGRQSDPAFVEVPYLRVANVQRGRLVLDKITTIRVPAAKAATLRLMPGDVLMNEGGDRDKLGRGWIWDAQVDDCIHQNHVFRARVLEERLHPKLLSWAGNTIGGRWCERNGKQSVNLASISLNKIRLMPVPVPPVELQPALVEHIEATLAGSDRLQAALEVQHRHLSSLRRSLLAAAFAGRLNGHTDVLERSHV